MSRNELPKFNSVHFKFAREHLANISDYYGDETLGGRIAYLSHLSPIWTPVGTRSPWHIPPHSTISFKLSQTTSPQPSTQRSAAKINTINTGNPCRHWI